MLCGFLFLGTPMKQLKPFFVLVLALGLVFLLPAQALSKSLPLTVVLDWFINPDHATLFIAETQGYFKEEGLEVTLVSPADSNDPPKWVAAGKADLALTYGPQFIEQVERGLPLIAIGTLIDKPLNCLLTLDDPKIQTLADLKGKKIGASSTGAKALMLKTMLQKQGLGLQDIELINVRHNLMQALLAGQVDAITGAMRNIEGVQAALYGRKPRLFFPEANGVPNYSELIFVAHQASLQNVVQKQRLRHFLLALEKASAYLKAHPEESWRAFSEKYPALKNEFNHRSWFATLPYFAAHPQKLSALEWRAFIAFMRQNSFIQTDRNLSAYMSEIV